MDNYRITRERYLILRPITKLPESLRYLGSIKGVKIVNIKNYDNVSHIVIDCPFDTFLSIRKVGYDINGF